MKFFNNKKTFTEKQSKYWFLKLKYCIFKSFIQIENENKFAPSYQEDIFLKLYMNLWRLYLKETINAKLNSIIILLLAYKSVF